MSFKAILKELVGAVPGAKSAIFVDYEGEAVDEYCSNGDSYRIKFLGAHHGLILNSVQRVSNATMTGNAKSVMIRTEKYDYFSAPVQDGYYVVMAVRKGCPPGQAQRQLERAVESIRIEMA